MFSNCCNQHIIPVVVSLVFVLLIFAHMSAFFSVSSKKNCLDYFMCFGHMDVCAPWMCVPGACSSQKRLLFPWNLNYRWFWVIMWMLGTELQVSVKVASTLNHWIIPAIYTFYFRTILMCVCVRVLVRVQVGQFNLCVCKVSVCVCAYCVWFFK